MTIEEKLQFAKDNKEISTEEIKQDIEDTKVEINELSREASGYRIVGDKMSRFKADNREIQIQERNVFIEKLEAILWVREHYFTAS